MTRLGDGKASAVRGETSVIRTRGRAMSTGGRRSVARTALHITTAAQQARTNAAITSTDQATAISAIVPTPNISNLTRRFRQESG
jgi:hypothetical protein